MERGREAMRRGLIVPLFVSMLAFVLSSCASTLRNEQLQKVAKDWSYVIRASQVIPVYPPNEDLQPGDVLLVSTPIEQQVKIYEKKGFLPLDQLLVRLDSEEFSDIWANDTFEDFYNQRYGTDGDLKTPGQWQKDKDGWQKAPRAAFPSYSFSVKSGEGLNLAIPISGVPLALGLMNSDAASGSVTLSKVSTYGLDNYRLNRIVSKWTRQNRPLLRNYEPHGDDRHFLRVVARVYVVGAVDVTMHNDQATSAEAKAGADRPVKLLGIDAQSTDANYRNAMSQINTLAKEVVPGGALKFASASSRAVTMTEDFPHPLVIGYIGFDLPIEAGGRTGAPISTLAQLTNRKTIPATAGRDSIYRLAALNLLYRELRAVESDPASTRAEHTRASEIQAKLDGLAKELPETYSFTLVEVGPDNTVRWNEEVGLPIEGAKVSRNVFTDVTDYLANARKTIESLERLLAIAPREAPNASLHAELERAREAYDQSAPILQGNASVLEAIDFVFLGS
jgi:hypothetical protein